MREDGELIESSGKQTVCPIRHSIRHSIRQAIVISLYLSDRNNYKDSNSSLNDITDILNDA